MVVIDVITFMLLFH